MTQKTSGFNLLQPPINTNSRSSYKSLRAVQQSAFRLFSKLRFTEARHSRQHDHSKRQVSCSAEAGQSRVEERKLPKDLSSKWSTATVVENTAVSVDGCLRMLVLSVEDKVVFLEGRTMHRKQERPRWADAYQVPGQFVAIRLVPNSNQDSAAEELPLPPNTGPHLFAIASSPYQVRRDSADLDASIIEILVDRHGAEHDQHLAQLGPGHLLEVSNVVGRGYASLFNSYVGLMSSLEDSRNLLLIGTGPRGIAPLRAVLEWTPVQAHATAHQVTLLYACSSATSAAFIKDWDSWREAGVIVKPIYLEEEGSDASGNGAKGKAAASSLQECIVHALLKGDHGLVGTVGGDLRDATVLLSGLPGSVAAAVSRELTSAGVESERVLFCDYF